MTHHFVSSGLFQQSIDVHDGKNICPGAHASLNHVGVKQSIKELRDLHELPDGSPIYCFVFNNIQVLTKSTSVKCQFRLGWSTCERPLEKIKTADISLWVRKVPFQNPSEVSASSSTEPVPADQSTSIGQKPSHQDDDGEDKPTKHSEDRPSESVSGLNDQDQAIPSLVTEKVDNDQCATQHVNDCQQAHDPVDDKLGYAEQEHSQLTTVSTWQGFYYRFFKYDYMYVYVLYVLCATRT